MFSGWLERRRTWCEVEHSSLSRWGTQLHFRQTAMRQVLLKATVIIYYHGRGSTNKLFRSPINICNEFAGFTLIPLGRQFPRKFSLINQSPNYNGNLLGEVSWIESLDMLYLHTGQYREGTAYLSFSFYFYLNFSLIRITYRANRRP